MFNKLNSIFIYNNVLLFLMLQDQHSRVFFGNMFQVVKNKTSKKNYKIFKHFI